MIFYLIGFCILESAGHRHYHVIHSWLDDQIPFCEYFIIPYLLWFVYLVVGICWFIFKADDKREYYKLVSVLALGMTVFLIVSCVYPNKQDLRPTILVGDSVFTKLVQWLYSTDTPTNILPSIHVFNSLALFCAVNGSPQLKEKMGVRIFTGALTLSGCVTGNFNECGPSDVWGSHFPERTGSVPKELSQKNILGAVAKF